MSAQQYTYQRRRPEASLLYRTLAKHLNTFLANLAEEGRSLPTHVEKELRSYLECGVLAYGFIRIKCQECKKEQLVAFSCKKRGFCPSCAGKKMAETATHLVDNMIPFVPIRQYVLSVPSPLRYWLASNKTLVREVHKILAETVEEFYCERKDKKTRSGAITFIQRFGGAINLNVHFHMLQIEGLYQEKSTGHHKFIKTPSPLDDDIKNLVEVIRDKIIQLLISCGYISEYEEEVTTPQDPLLEEEPAYAVTSTLGPVDNS